MRRFAKIKVGDVLVWVVSPVVDIRGRPLYETPPPDLMFVVTDLWWDPVRGQHNRASGEMVAVRRRTADGILVGRKRDHTVRGLAQAGFRYADKPPELHHARSRRAPDAPQGTVH